LLLADISGYTEYLVGAEAHQGSAVASDLISQVVDGVRPHFKVNKLEGDAVFAVSESLTGPELLDLMDGVYATFRRRLLSFDGATSCSCPACGVAPRLDLKLIAHTGRYAEQRIGNRIELAGREVIVAHRLLKNSLGFAGPASGYALLTNACVTSLSIDPIEEMFTPHQETYEHLGTIDLWVANLADRLAAQPSWLPPANPLHEEITRFQAPAADVWALVAPGRSESCVTSRLRQIHEIIEWRPFERLVVKVDQEGASVFHEATFIEEGGETVARLRWFRGRRRRGSPSWEEIASLLAMATRSSLETARQRLPSGRLQPA
jgi:hypothetical protein